MSKETIISRIKEKGLVAVVRAESAEQAGKIADACIKGGVAALEITFTVKGALDVIKSLADSCDEDKIIIGAGTVLDAETARAAILAGAKYIVSPCLDRGTAVLCNRYAVPYMPGAL